MYIIERAKRAHSLVMTFEIFGIGMLVRMSSVLYLEYVVMRMLCQLKINGLKLNGKQAQRAGVIKCELAILQQSTTLSKLCNGTLDVASTLPFPELRTQLEKNKRILVRYLE